MSHIFSNDKNHSFSWDNLDINRIKDGRGELGVFMPVMIHRLMDNALYETLKLRLHENEVNLIYKEAGMFAGKQFASNMLNLNTDISSFLASLQDIFIELKIGILRVELYNSTTKELILTVGEDVACSGLPIMNDTVCHYDEGFLTGIFQEYTKENYDFVEIDCWASGARFCRFRGSVSSES